MILSCSMYMKTRLQGSLEGVFKAVQVSTL